MNMLAFTMRQHQVGPFAFSDDAAIAEIQRVRRVFGHQTNRLRQGKAVTCVVGDAESGIQQAGGIVIGRENIQQPERGELAGGNVAGMRSAAHDIRRAHQDVHSVLA
ncbi:hypothetical protein D3C78_1455280 [compost metagenome]